MASWLVDTGVLLRAFHPSEPDHQLSADAVALLRKRGDELCVGLQGLSEFWNVCTGPRTARGGFGLTVAQTERRIRVVERHTTFLVDIAPVRTHWRRLVLDFKVQGVQVHDARLVALMLAHGVTHLLSFSTADFRRYPGIVVVSPQDVLAGRV
jgi:predicted nucleic acid-binding protein